MKKTGKLLLVLLTVLALLCAVSCGQKEPPELEDIDLTPLADGAKYVETSEVTDLVCIRVKDYGDIVIRLFPDVAPETVENFQNLVADGFYDGIIFHRVIKNFMIQTGDPEGTGMGGSEKTIHGEFTQNGFVNHLVHRRGTVSMARQSGNMDSASSQFFIVHQTSQSNSHSLNGQYASFGFVVKGIEIVDAIAGMPTDPADDKPLTDIVMESVRFVKMA